MFSKCLIKDNTNRGSLLSMSDEEYKVFIEKSKLSICVIVKYTQDNEKCLVAFNYKDKQYEAWFYTNQIECTPFSCFEGGIYVITLKCKCGETVVLEKFHHKDTVAKNWRCKNCYDNKNTHLNIQYTNSGADNSYWQIGDKRVYS